MCTVTLIISSRDKNEFILTSNRDEAVGRETLPPIFEDYNGTNMLYPKDKLAGGTWIGISEKSRLVCLLNGGFENHIREEYYKESRGVIVKKMLAVEQVENTIKDYDFKDIEPFTMIIVDWKNNFKALEVVWDSKKLHLKNLANSHYIWSSSPLYNIDMKTKREGWFKKFLFQKKLSKSNIWDFHHHTGENNKEVDFIMDRGFIKTQSISQISNTNKKTAMKYHDLNDEKITEIKFNLTQKEH